MTGKKRSGVSRPAAATRDAASGSAGALVGLAVGGPVGAVAGAVVAAATTQVANVVNAHLRQRRDRLLQRQLMLWATMARRRGWSAIRDSFPLR